MAKSKFCEDGYVNKTERRFETWLLSQGYDACSDMYPAAIIATSLVDEYYQAYPEQKREADVIEAHAEKIGWISDYTKEEDEDGDDDEFSDYDW